MRARIPLPLLVLALLFLATAPAAAHSGAAAAADEPKSIFRLERLSEHAWALFGRGGNVGFLVTPVGVLVVDDQYGDIAEGIVEQIRTVTDEPIRFLVNTHYHDDHTGGNPVFHRFATIVAHRTVRPRLLDYPVELARDLPAEIRRYQAEIADLPDESDPYRVALSKNLDLLNIFMKSAGEFVRSKVVPPDLTYDRQVSVWLGDQEIEIFHVAPGHTDGDSIVYFRTEKVLHMGDVFFHGMYPFIDTRGGGSFKGMIESVGAALDRVPADARVIPGHGSITDVKSLRRYHSFLVDLQKKVRAAIDGGQTRAEAVRSIEMPEYPEIQPLWLTLGHEVLAAWDEMAPRR